MCLVVWAAKLVPLDFGGLGGNGLGAWKPCRHGSVFEVSVSSSAEVFGLGRLARMRVGQLPVGGIRIAYSAVVARASVPG